jgi:predicted peptidase
MAFASPTRLGLVAVVCALSLGCSDAGGTTDMLAATADSGGATDMPATTAGSGGASGETAGAGGMTVDPNGGAPVGPASGRHTQRPSGSVPDTTAGYWEYLPPHYGNGALYPLLVFRHGIGQNGNGTTELQKVVKHGPPKLIEANQWPEDRTFVVLSVQHPGGGCPSSEEIDDFLKFAIANYDIDPTRVYLTGLSCGAKGSWNYLGDHTNETVAAAVLISGNGRAAFMKAGCGLGKVPIWAFHGEADTSVDPQGSIEPVTNLEACTNPAAVDVKLTTYPGVGHDSWTMTYDLSNPANDIYAWMMTHMRE